MENGQLSLFLIVLQSFAYAFIIKIFYSHEAALKYIVESKVCLMGLWTTLTIIVW